jgi:UDP-N-acetylmuramoyl-L-alanyl-D-glutamate--2,6-diaminopimelate ligase
VRLGDLSAGLPGLIGAGGQGGEGDVEVSSLAYDSRAVTRGTLFFCVPGFRSDGHRFAPAAVQAGAAALVVERPLGLGVPELVVESVRAAMAPLAARFYGEPGAELQVVGVTGTNGKTTSAYLVRELLEAGGIQCGLLGTVKSVIGGAESEVVRTTPEAIDLQADLRAMLDGGDRACAIEVSSHALELGRAAAIPFAAALFTNLTQDHLDFHPTMEDYFLAKRRLFDPDGAGGGPPPGVSVVNVADPYGRRLAGELATAVTFAVEGEADYTAADVRCGFAGCSFTLKSPEGEHAVTLPMPGRFNVANALGALAVVHRLGVPLATALAALERGVRVPGRFEPVERGQGFAALVDYAHTPDSLENVLAAARELVEEAGAQGAAPRRVLCVFGAGGDRDRGKRPLMGEIAARLADVTIVTSDNPRSEPPAAIIEEIMGGAGQERTGSLEAIEDRRAAIARAVALAAPGDVLVVAGKGHEQGQEFAEGRKIPFDDVAVTAEALDERLAAGAAAGASGAVAVDRPGERAAR